MKRRYLPVRLALVLLAAALFWRMLGAPVTPGDWQGLEVPFWQARVLLPGRLERVLLLWQNMGSLSSGSGMATLQEEERLLSVHQSEPVVLQVWNAEKQLLEEMELETYVQGVVAAEMPAAYHLEALKAQAVAARTRAVAQMNGGGCSLSQGADVCMGSGHCQGYADEAALQARWGNEYLLYRQRVLTAAADTAGQILTWQGEPITVMYHAISGGRTENVQAVFSEALPYLVSVESTGEEGARGYRQDTFFAFDEAAQLLATAFPQLEITPQTLRRTLMIASHTETGRVQSLLLCGSEVEGTAFRSALGLRSTLFTFSMDEAGITFHQTGYGHGVGMSQTGANSMAANGSSYQQILAHYYPDTTLEKR